MLQKLNERIQGVVAWVVIILVAVTFTLFGIDYYMQSRHESNAQIEVNGESITKQAFETNYRRLRQLSDPSRLTLAGENQMKQQVMDDMVLNTVSMQAARAHGFEVTSEQANAAILSIPQFQEDGHFSSSKYQQALNGALFTPESFYKEVRQGMLLNQQRFAFMGTSFALPHEINQFVKLYMQTRDYDYMQIPALRFIKPSQVSEQDVNAYFQTHQKEFVSPEQVRVDYIRLSLRDIKKRMTVSEQDIERHYQENQSNYYAPAQWQVAHILFAVEPDASQETRQHIKQQAEKTYQSLLKHPEQFEKNVVSHSDDKISAANGGVLPWIVAGQSGFDNVLVHMTTPGQISAPTKSAHGYEIFKLVAHKPAAVQALSDVKTEIREQLVADLAQAEYARELEQLSDLSYQTPDSLQPVAEALSLTVQRSDAFSREGGKRELSKNKQVVAAAFSHDVLELGNNSEPIQLDNESVAVLRVHERIPAAMKALSAVRPMIIDVLAKNRAKVEAKALGNALLRAKQPVSQQEKLMSEHRLQWQSVTQATRDADPSLAVINEVAFNLPRVGVEVGRSLIDGDYVIVHLKKINDGHVDALDKEQVASITQQIEANYGLMDYDLYVGNLLKQATIVKH